LNNLSDGVYDHFKHANRVFKHKYSRIVLVGFNRYTVAQKNFLRLSVHVL